MVELNLHHLETNQIPRQWSDTNLISESNCLILAIRRLRAYDDIRVQN